MPRPPGVYSKKNLIRTIAMGDDTWKKFNECKQPGQTANDVLKKLLDNSDIKKIVGK